MNIFDPGTKVVTPKGSGEIVVSMFDPMTNKASYRVKVNDEIITCGENEIEIQK